MGYGDVVLEAPWRTLGTLAGADGYMTFGPATAMLYAVLGGLIGRSQK